MVYSTLISDKRTFHCVSRVQDKERIYPPPPVA